VEALARSGVGKLDLVDDDKVAWSNLNRQIIATTKTVGQYKVDVAKERILEINPRAHVETYKVFYMPDTAKQFEFSKYDYVVDAIDTVGGKLELVEQAYRAGTRIISSMGAGNKMDATAFEVADIHETSVCPLARIMRRELKKRGILSLKVVYSQEKPRIPLQVWGTAPSLSERGFPMNVGGAASLSHPKRQTPGSNAFVPAVAGLIIAGEVVRDLAGV
jgi:tRNA A37 threonylcarbamoyladenosine dehydratase